VVGGERENTLGSYRAAVAAGAEWVEVDARFDGDDVLVASHDPVIGDGRFISELSAAESEAAGLMRVADLLEDLPPEIGVDIDVKSSLEDAQRPRERTTGALVADLVARAAGRPLLVTSFDPAALLIFRERVPDVPLGLITWTRFPFRKAVPAAVHLGVEVVASHFGSFDLGQEDAPLGEREPERVVAVAHEAGLQVVSWCPRGTEADRLLDAGVDCIVVDDLPVALRAFGSRRASV
jgi:glycerophosphoryl diester phosphodiesterase